MKILILAGGEGARLWPISRKSFPKQIRSFFNNQTLLEQTLARIRQGFKNRDIYISTLAKYYPAVRKKTLGIPKENFFLEPVRRDRGPAIGLAATIIQKRHPNSIFATAWADHYIPEVNKYLQILRLAETVVKQHPEFTVLIGIKPHYATSSLGYIQKGKVFGRVQEYPYYLSKKFIEKPKQKLASRLVKTGYVWNPGIFVWKTSHLLSLYEKYSLKNFQLLEKIGAFAKNPKLGKIIQKVYPKLRSEEIENAILEKTENKLVIPVDLVWADIGTYKSLKEILTTRPHRNLLSGLVKCWQCEDNFIYETDLKKLAVGIGLKNLVIVDTKDVLLVTNKDSADDLKTYLNKIRRDQKLHRFL